MGCRCKEHDQRDTSIVHGKFTFLSLNNQTSPVDGCLYCAEKHLALAAVLAKEHGYEGVNRGYIIGEIVAACWHLNGTKLTSAKSLATKLRTLRHKIQSRTENESTVDFSSYLTEIDKLIQADINTAKRTVDVIIPLGPGSCSNNDELRLFLRSLEKNAKQYGTIWIVTDKPPIWLKTSDNLKVIELGDPYKHNKDANLFEKAYLALQNTMADEVVFTADDCIIMKQINLSTIPPVKNSRGYDAFKEKDGKWAKRMAATLKELNMLNSGNWDSHCPQRWNTKKAIDAILNTPYSTPEGRCIDTAIMGRIFDKKIPADTVEQSLIKETIENENAIPKFDKTYIGYNDAGFKSVLKDKLFEMFPNPSQWEKT